MESRRRDKTVQHLESSFFRDTDAAEEYWNRVSQLTSLEPVPIGALVTQRYVFDLLVLYESLLASWTFYPFELHAFALEDEVESTLAGLGIDQLHVHRLPGTTEDWIANAARKAELVEHCGLERCVITDVDNVFVAETPELYLLLDKHDMVFVGGPSRVFRVQTNLWSFRRNERTIAFARHWYSHSKSRQLADASGFPFALMKSGELGVDIKLLTAPTPQEGSQWLPAPYDIQANMTPFVLRSDELGFREDQMGRAKVIHLAVLRGRGAPSVEQRVDMIIHLFPGCASFLPYYAELADRAARRLGIPTVDDPASFVKRRLLEKGVLAGREELPLLLNARGLQGTAVAVADPSRRPEEVLGPGWDGERLITIDRRGEDGSAGQFASQSIDFAFIDAGHAGDFLAAELALWFDKLRPGGLIAGSGDLGGGSEVPSVVGSFFDERGLRVRTTYDEASCPTWYVEKPSSRAQHAKEHLWLLKGKIWSELAKKDTDRAAVRRWSVERDSLEDELSELERSADARGDAS